MHIVPRTMYTAALLLAFSAGLSGLSGCAQIVQSRPPGGSLASAGPVEPPPPPTLAPGTRVAGVDVGGATQERAGHLVRYHLRSLHDRPITLYYEGKTYARTWKELGIRPDDEGMVAAAWTQADVPLSAVVDLARAKASIRRAALALDRAPVAPRFTGAPAASSVKPGTVGRTVNVHNSALHLQALIARDPMTERSPLRVAPVEPGFTVEDLQAIRQPVVKYSTRFNPGERSRTHNLRLVTERLNGALVLPGETFSFNEWVGERRPEDGFQEAVVFKEGKMVKGTGGGLCQVSSTLYNVALLAGLPIVERSNHSLTVAYVPLGRDAMVYWGQQDLRFGNDTDMPLYIRAVAGRNTLTIEAWGVDPLSRKVDVTSESSRRDGKAFAQVHRVVVEKGKRIRERVSSDVYSTAHGPAPAPTRNARS